MKSLNRMPRTEDLMNLFLLEQSRNQKPVRLHGIDRKAKVYGTLLNNGISKNKDLTLQLFDEVFKVREHGGYIHAIGYRN